LGFLILYNVGRNILVLHDMLAAIASYLS
jgi:hypothetical protein